MDDLDHLFDNASDTDDGSNKDRSRSSHDDGMTIGESSTAESRKQEADRHALFVEETKAVRRLRLLVICTLSLITIIVGAVIFWHVQNLEQKEFQNEFQEQGQKLVSGFRSGSFQKLQALESLSSSISSYVQASNMSWPCVTIPEADQFLTPYLSLANAASIKMLPVVHSRRRLEWEDHVQQHQDWLTIPEDSELHHEQQDLATNNIVSPYIKNYAGVDTSPFIWLPNWQYAPVIANRWFLNFNQLADADFYRDSQAVLNGNAVISAAQTYAEGLDFQSTKDLEFTQELLEAGGYGFYEPGEPIGYIHYPVFEHEGSINVAAVLTATVYWKTYFQNIFLDDFGDENNGDGPAIICVVENDRQVFTYEIQGEEAIFLGMQDFHDPQYDSLVIHAQYDQSFTTKHRYTGVPVDSQANIQTGAYRIRVYPNFAMEMQYSTNNPWYYAAVVILVMAFAIVTFILYDCYVERRQKKVQTVAVQSSAIVSSLFPEKIKNKLFSQEGPASPGKQSKAAVMMNSVLGRPIPNPLKPPQFDGSRRSAEANFDDDSLGAEITSPIADFFPSATVSFMDIAGFTAWSSAREPSQVFILLETIYKQFDKLAKSRKVFKVETIGDCYLAVCGLPEPNEHHAECMARFSRGCLEKMKEVAHRLEPKLGPDTGDLSVRVGLHSGPVTAGVLRGERARFQLFGDTVNTAARMESTGTPGRIQISQECADCLIKDGRGSWIRKRKEAVQAKGKGDLQTYWLLPNQAKSKHSSDSGPSLKSKSVDIIQSMSRHISFLPKINSERRLKMEETMVLETPRLQRLVDFNLKLLLNILQKIIAKNAVMAKQDQGSSKMNTFTFRKQPFSNDAVNELKNSDASNLENKCGIESGSCLAEVAEIIELPNFNQAAYNEETKVQVPLSVVSQLRQFCEIMSKMYHNNAFHNFDHASHVTQSTVKLLSRIVAAKDCGVMEDAHDHTFGIASDPLTQFAVVFAALVHDVDHRGVPNFVLAKEEPEMADLYQHQAIAEQNSLDIAWNVLMEPSFDELRRTIYQTEAELKRFRQLVVNCLLATDIFDAGLKSLREQRWNNAFHGENTYEDFKTATNRKATIVIEHIIQASDVSHTMQHWHVYSKYNERLFQEMLKAFHDGRSDKDPTAGWYLGELWFFDNYVIPLAMKLKECGVFGVSSDEYLNYARENRKEWEKKGQAMVEDYLENFQLLYSTENRPN